VLTLLVISLINKAASLFFLISFVTQRKFISAILSLSFYSSYIFTGTPVMKATSFLFFSQRTPQIQFGLKPGGCNVQRINSFE